MKTSKNSSDALAREIMERLDVLSELSESPDNLTRRYLTPEHASANAQVGEWMQAAGMTVRTDAVGNIIGRYEGTQPGAPALILGSHLDTVIDAGRYDGMLGVVLPISCVAELSAAGERFPFAIEVIGFGDEEGVRFQSTYLGSSPVAGTFQKELLERTDREGISLRDALTAFGLNPEKIGSAARKRTDVLAYMEVHIEQGPVLEQRDCPVGIVTAIAGATRLEITLSGEAGHAGTVPMTERRDALAAAAEIILSVEEICQSRDGLVGTVGQLDVSPGAVNVIPGAVRLSVDLRAAEDDIRQRALGTLYELVSSIGEKRHVETNITQTHAVASVPCASQLITGLSSAASACGHAAPMLSSGAGHDAVAMSALTEIGMLFVRCEGGISHNARESIEASDVAVAVEVLSAFLKTFDETGKTGHDG